MRPLLLILLAGCWRDLSTECPDEDLDGYYRCADEAADCNDADPRAHPDAAERCNAADDDCDGELAPFERDRDEDGDLRCAPDCDDEAPGATTRDDDGDGFSVCAGDCDDADPARHPGAPERCDLIDEDCDGQPDDGFPAERYLLDLDGDGYGDPATGVLACTPPEPGRITQGGDCDDGDPAVHRDVDELCNGVDDDCDGAIDEPSAIDAAIHYLDADGDGTGDPLTRTRSCVIPFGHVSNGDDCDDASADRSPLLDERCDHVDNDCDQVVDEHPIDPTWTWLDDDRDGFGVDGTGAWMCFPGPDRALEGGDCDDRRAAVNPAAVEVCNGRDDDCDGDADSDAVDRAQVWRDDDGDGWGDRAQSRLACLPAPGWATQADDCDDHVASTHPGASEVCNHVDDDCDARVDESPVDAVIGYLDRDHDGFGTGARAAHCPYESADDDDDCDDSEARIHPGASEVCVGVDGDCDGVIGCGGDGVCTPQEEASGQLCEDCPPMKEVGQAVPGTCPGSATFAVDCQICGDSPTTCSGTVEAVPGVTTTIATLAPGECHTLRGVATGRTSCVIWDPNGAHTLELTYCYEVPCPEDDPSCRELDRCDADPTWTYNCTP